MDPDAVLLDRRVDYSFYRSKQRVLRKRQRLRTTRYREELTFMDYHNGKVTFNTIPKISDSGARNSQVRLGNKYMSTLDTLQDGQCHCRSRIRSRTKVMNSRTKELKDPARCAPNETRWYWDTNRDPDVFDKELIHELFLKAERAWIDSLTNDPHWRWMNNVDLSTGRELDLFDFVVPSRGRFVSRTMGPSHYLTEERRQHRRLRQAVSGQLPQQCVDFQDDWVEVLSDTESDCQDSWDLCD